MSRKIVIDGDVSALKKSVLDIARTISKDLGKSKIELFTPDTKKFLRSEAVAQAENLKKQIDAIKDSTKRHQAALKEVVAGSKEELRLKEKILKASQHINKIEKDRQKTNEMNEQLQGATFSKQFMKFSGLSTILKGLKGVAGEGGGMMAGMGGLLGGGLLAAGGFAASRVMAARDTWTGGVDTRLKLMGRGVSDMQPSNTAAMTGAGLNALTLRQARLRDMDVFGREGATQNAVIQRAGFERNFGIEEGTMSGIGAQMRSSMGGKQANMTVMKLQASLIASGISDAIGPYLETAAQMLTDLNEKGFTHDESVTSLFNAMMKTGMGEGRIQKLATSADQGIRGSSGEANAFFQSAFNKAGIGGGTIGGAQAAMRMGGLFGVDLNKYKGMGATDINTFKALGIGGPNHMKAVAGATLGQLDKLFGSNQDIDKQLGSKDKNIKQGGATRRLGRLRYMMQAFGLKDEGQAGEVEGLLEKAKTASPAEQKNIMERVKNIQESTPELDNLKTINKSTAGVYDILKNEKTTLEDALGEKIAPLFNEANKLLLEIDKAILYVVEKLGFKTDEEKKKSILDAVNKGEVPAGADVRDYKNLLTPEQNREIYENAKKRASSDDDDNFFGSKAANARMVMNSFTPEEKKSMDEQAERERKRIKEGPQYTSMNQNSQSPFIPTSPQPLYSTPMNQHSKEQLDIFKQIARSSEVTAKNTKEKGSLPAFSSSTVGN